jgi:hypothetical protein
MSSQKTITVGQIKELLTGMPDSTPAIVTIIGTSGVAITGVSETITDRSESVLSINIDLDVPIIVERSFSGIKPVSA